MNHDEPGFGRTGFGRDQICPEYMCTLRMNPLSKWLVTGLWALVLPFTKTEHPRIRDDPDHQGY